MKAAVYITGETPRYEDYPEPIPQHADEILLTMRASAIKHLDKIKVSGKHYSSIHDGAKRVAGVDGVGIMENGTRVYAFGSIGMMAEKAVVNKEYTSEVPDGVSDAIAAALPNGVMGAALALKYRAAIQHGETVLINGATGFTGKVAIQIAKHYGAKKIIVTGRNERVLQSLTTLGADEVISLHQEDASFVNKIKEIHAQTPIDVVIDYIWGYSAELILSALKGTGTFSHRTRYVTVGAMSGDTIQLSSQILRSIDIQLSGSGIGSWTKEEFGKLFSEILPDMFQLAAEGKLVIDVTTFPLLEIERNWNEEAKNGERLVVLI